MAIRSLLAKLGIGTRNYGPADILPRPQTPDMEIPRAEGYAFMSLSSSTLPLQLLAPPPPGSSSPVQLRPNSQVSGQTAPPGLDDENELNGSSLTCSLNLVCYRAGRQGCVVEQIRVAKPGFIPGTNSQYVGVTLIDHDAQFFRVIRETYTKKMCSIWRRYLSLKNLRQIRLLSYTPKTRPEVVRTNTFALQEILHTYKNPPKNSNQVKWIDWVFQLRKPDHRHALEFVEGWSSARIAIIGSVPWVVATIVGILWAVYWGDTQTAFTVAAYILSVGTFMLALLAIVSNFE